MAMFSVDADAAQRMIDYSGLQVCRYRPERAVVVLMLMHYVDGDLGQYLEYGTNVMVNPPGSRRHRAEGAAVRGRLHPPSAGRQALHVRGGTDDLGLPEGDGGLHRSRRPPVRLRRDHRRPVRRRHGLQPRAARAVGADVASPRCTRRTPTSTASPAKPPAR